MYTMWFAVIFSIFMVTILPFLYLRWTYAYWRRRGLYMYQGSDRTSLKTYQAIRKKGLRHGAFKSYFRSHYMPIDLEIVKDILVRNADHFINRGMYCNPKIDPLSASIPQLENQDWKDVRSIVSQIFSPGKLKTTFPFLLQHANIMLTVIEGYANSMEAVEAKSLAKRYGMDAMGTCIFGFEINTLKGQNIEFQELMKSFQKVTWKRIADNIVHPRILKAIRFRMSNPDLEKCFRNIIDDVSFYREKNNIQRKDIFWYMEQLTDKQVVGDKLTENKKLSGEQMFVQLHSFFMGGFDTSSIVISFTLLELCQHQEIQDKLREEISKCLKKHGELTYEALLEMDYLDRIVSETSRKHTPVPYTVRFCNKAYNVPGTNFTIRPGESVAISYHGIHMDPEYYPDPDKFDPERYTPEVKATRPAMTFFAFGEGPRNCLGSRMGLLVTKVAIAAIISKFVVTLNSKTVNPIRYKDPSFVLEVDGGVWVNFSKVKM